MNPPSFVRQDDQPLYPNILYNRPVTRIGAGRLLVVGGHAHEFSLPTTINQLALAAGVGECRVMLPDVLAKTLSGAPGTYFGSTGPSGSLEPAALGRILELSDDADAVIVGPSLSNNSATAMLIEKLVTQVERPLIAVDDALIALHHHPEAVTQNPQALLIVTMAEVFKLSGALGIPINIRPGAGLINKLEIVQNLQTATACSYAVYGTEIIVATPSSPNQPPSELIVTPINYHLSLVPALFYAVMSTFWLQNPTDHRAGLATGAHVIRQASAHLGPTDRPAVSDLAQALQMVLRRDEF